MQAQLHEHAQAQAKARPFDKSLSYIDEEKDLQINLGIVEEEKKSDYDSLCSDDDAGEIGTGMHANIKAIQ